MVRSKCHSLLMLVAAALAGGGCLPCYHQVCTPLGIPESCQLLPLCARQKVYVFLVDGCDPTNCANFKSIKGYLHELGFTKTYYGQFYYTSWYIKEIRKIHECEPDAHFVLIGYNLGADAVRKVACAVADDGVAIDLLVYVDAVTVANDQAAQPMNVQRVVNFVSSGCLVHGQELDQAENHHLARVGHYGLPTCEFTVVTLSNELMRVAANVETAQPVPTLMPMIDEAAPTPRPVQPRSMQPRDQWDYMKPVTSLTGRPDAVQYHPASRETVVSTPIDNRQTLR